MSVSLFRRWRSQKFSDLVGQESVVSTLQNVLGAGDPARAYLFCGPRGTGKTSSARIFAKALNCENGPSGEPCNQCSQCESIAEGNNLDVFEIDAASHTQVDKIRDFIVEKVHFTPVSARYKVYIIDEVHKLSTSSFNALLKTLEEPPAHVVFVLATTHPHEMPSTILSRCQRYDFRPLTASETEKHLQYIASEEKIQLDEDAARQLARAADGSLRDALVLFEQAHVFSDGRVTRDKVLDLLGGVGYEVLEDMFTDLQQGRAAQALQRLDEWIVRGRDLKRLAESFQDHLRMMLLLKVKSEDQSIKHLSAEERASLDRLTQLVSVGAITQWLRAVGEMLGEIRHGRRARLEWEMFLVSLAHPESDPSLEGLERRLERLESGGPVTPAATDSAPLPMPSLLPRLEALESQIESRPASSGDQTLARELEQKVKTLESKLEDSVRPDQLTKLERKIAYLTARLESAPATSAPSPEPSAPQRPPVATPSPVSPQTPLSDGTLDRDLVDDWLAMPEVLVTRKISQSGQIDLLGGVDSPDDQDEVPWDDEEPLPQAYAEDDSNWQEPMIPSEPNLEELPLAEIVDAPAEEEPEPWEDEPPVEEQDETASETEDTNLVSERPTEYLEELPPEEESVEYLQAPDPEDRPTEPMEMPAPPPAEPSPAERETQSLDPPKKPEASNGVSQGAESAGGSLPDSKEFFRLLMQQVKEQDIRLHAVLADARLTHLDESRFELAVPAGYDWHFGKIGEGKSLLESVAKNVTGGMSLQMDSSIGGEKAAPPKENEHEELVKRASGVFGGSSIID